MKMPRLSRHIAVTAGLVGAIGAFGAGAYALSQGGSSFDPSAFIAAYDRGSQDSSKGYEANLTETDADANRRDDASSNRDKSADTRNNAEDKQARGDAGDVPTSTVSGTTAVRVAGNGSNSGVNVAGDGAGGNGGGNVVYAPVISGGGSGATGNPGGGSSATTPGGGSATPGGGNAKPGVDGPYGGLLPSDPVKSEKDLDDTYMHEKPVTSDNEAIGDLTYSDVMVSIQPYNVFGASNEAVNLYSGQVLDAWTIFCSLRASYSYRDAKGDMQVLAWWSTKKDFDSYPYFKVLDFPKVAPNEPFQIKVAYRINDHDSWHEETIDYTPEQSCTYAVSGRYGSDGARVVLDTYYSADSISMNRLTLRLMDSMGYLDEDDTLSHLLLNWSDGSKDVNPLGTYEPKPGRHVLAPGEFVEVPQGCTAKLTDTWVGDDLYQFQTLAGVADGSPLVEEGEDGAVTVRVPEGFENVELDQDACLEADYLDLSRTVVRVETSGTCLRVERGYRVSDDNPVYAVDDQGVLTDKAGTEYYGVPAALKKLVVAEGVTSVKLPEACSLKQIVFEGGIPAIDLSSVMNCNIVVNDGDAAAFLAEYASAFTAKSGNTISLASRPEVALSAESGVLTHGSTVVKIADLGSSWAVLPGDADKTVTLAARCLVGNETVDTIVFTGAGDCELDDGSLAGSTVSTIVCANERQAASVRRRLAAAGAPDAQVTVLEHTDDDFWYYTEQVDGESATVLFRAPHNLQEFYGSFELDDGSDVEPERIASGAFESCDRLEWLQTGEGTSYIGSEAFRGCDALQGIFLGCPDTVTLEKNAFANCSNARFMACRAKTGIVEDGNTPNTSCLMYAPTDCDGYTSAFQAFTPDSGVEDYTAIREDDGSLILCGSSAVGGNWLVLACGNELSGAVVLPSETIEIFQYAFSGVGGSFTVNWDDMESLRYVDIGAFSASGLAGDVTLGSMWTYYVSVAESAFSGCDGIESLTSEASLINMGAGAFGDCHGLKSVKLAGSKDYSGGSYITTGAFYDCPALTQITLTGYSVPNLSYYGTGSPFCFDGAVSPDDDADRIHIIVNEGMEQQYLDAWVWFFTGYADYDDCYDAVYDDLLYRGRDYGATSMVPTSAEVKQEMIRRLTVGENRLRKMLGMPQVSATTVFSTAEKDGCTFDTQKGVTTLTGVPRDATEIDVSAAAPEGVDDIVIPANAFARCKNLKRIVLGSKVSEIKPGAFTGCDGVTVLLPSVDASLDADDMDLEGAMIHLTVDEDEAPFDFGAKIVLTAPDADVEKYLKIWPRQMAGHESWGISSYVMQVYWVLCDAHEPEQITADMLNFSVNDPIVEQENVLRRLFGLPEVSDYKDASSFYDASWYLEPWGGSDDDDDLPDLPEADGEGEADAGSGDAATGGSDSDAAADGSDSQGASDGAGSGSDAGTDADVTDGGQAQGDGAAQDSGQQGSSHTSGVQGAAVNTSSGSTTHHVPTTAAVGSNRTTDAGAK